MSTLKLSLLEQTEGKIFIDGVWKTASGGKIIDVFSPATGEKVGTIGSAEPEDVQAATDSAYRAFETWKELPARTRADYMMKAFQLMIDHKDELARIITLENGKPLAEAYGELAYAGDFVQWFAEEAKRSYGETIPASTADKRIMVIKQPVGVVGAITPWNFPAAMATRKIAPALAAGCTVVLKPATKTPLTAAAICRIFEMAGVPAGVINLLPSQRASIVSGSWMKDERVRKITFTGSTEIGKILIEQSAGQVKKLSMELGGNAPLIVFDDADLETAVQGALNSKFRCGGQSCIASNRMYVQDGIYEKFAERFAAEVAKLKAGDGLAEGTTVGPVIDEGSLKSIEAMLEDAKSKGAKVAAGGSRVGGGANLFLHPTVLTEINDSMQIVNEEIFGPVAPLIRFKTDDEVIRAANNTPFGLASYIFSDDLDRCIRISERLEFGIVGVNDGLPSAAQAPFGGMKESGMGREGSHYGLADYQEMKYISIKLKQK